MSEPEESDEQFLARYDSKWFQPEIKRLLRLENEWEADGGGNVDHMPRWAAKMFAKTASIFDLKPAKPEMTDEKQFGKLAIKAGWGRVHVVRANADAAKYLAKYLSKDREPCLKGWRLWAGFGKWDWSRVKDIFVETPKRVIWAACKEALNWKGNRGFLEKREMVDPHQDILGIKGGTLAKQWFFDSSRKEVFQNAISDFKANAEEHIRFFREN